MSNPSENRYMILSFLSTLYCTHTLKWCAQFYYLKKKKEVLIIVNSDWDPIKYIQCIANVIIFVLSITHKTIIKKPHTKIKHSLMITHGSESKSSVWMFQIFVKVQCGFKFCGFLLSLKKDSAKVLVPGTLEQWFK